VVVWQSSVLDYNPGQAGGGTTLHMAGSSSSRRRWHRHRQAPSRQAAHGLRSRRILGEQVSPSTH
jgi:hypothetical protein